MIKSSSSSYIIFNNIPQNTFHFAGVSAKDVTLGVPRLRELINVAKTNKTPSLTVFLKKGVREDHEKAKSVLNTLEYTTLVSITDSTEIWYDPDPENTVVEEDKEFVDDYFAIPDEDMPISSDTCSPWMLRIILNRRKKEVDALKKFLLHSNYNAHKSTRTYTTAYS